MHVLITGGAGFIGANFVHQTWCVTRTPPSPSWTGLTYAGNKGSLADLDDRVTPVLSGMTLSPTSSTQEPL